MYYTFNESQFNGDISKWNVSKVTNMSGMFYYSKFNRDISKWDVSSVDNTAYMFFRSKFNRDISNWKISKDCVVLDMFRYCPIKEEYKPELPE